MALAELVRKVRTTLGEFPDRSFVATATGTATPGAADTITIAPGDAAKFPVGGRIIEFDDGTDEKALTTGPANADDNGLPVRRGMDGTTAPDHVADTPILIEPRFGFGQVAGALQLVVDTEMWPYVWQRGEATLTPDFTVNAYDGPAGIEEVVYAYQLVDGFTMGVHARLMSAVTADDTNFPTGAVLIDPASIPDSSAIFLSYRLRATVANITPDSSLEHLAVLGAVAHLMLMEESLHLGPSSSANDRGVAEGAKLRAGAVQWDRFEKARGREMISLTHEEQMRRRTFLRGA